MRDIKYHSDIQQQPEIYPILIDTMPQGVATLNEEGVILFCNPSFAEMMNQPRRDVVGTKFKNYIADSSKDLFDTLYKQSWQNPVKDEIHLNNHSKMIMPVLISANTFKLNNTILLSIILSDVSVQNKNQNDLKNRTNELAKSLLQLKESEEQFRLIIENVKDYSIIMLDANGNIKTWNKGAERIKGYKANDIIGKHISIVYTQEEILRKEPERNLKLAKDLGRYESGGWRVRKDGSTYFADVIITSVYDDNNNFQGYVKITRDITERKKAEDKLKDSETQILTIFKRAPDAVTVMDQDGIITKWNPRAEAIFGWSAEEVIGHPLHETLIPERFREAHLKGMKHFFATGEGPILNKPIDMPALRKDNSEIQIELSISHYNFKEKDFFIGFLKDITKRKIAEDKLKESEERFLKIFDYSPVAMTLSEIKTNKIAFVNNLFYTTFGYTAEEVIGRTSEELSLLAPEELKRVTSLILDYLQEERSLFELQSMNVEDTEALLIKLNQSKAKKDFEVQYTRKNGETFYALVFFETIRIGYQSYTITSYQDITERKIAEEKVKQKSRELELLNQELAIKSEENERRARELSLINKELLFQIEEKEKKDAALTTANTDLREKEELIAHKDSILAILSHDLRSPLTGIIGAAEYLHENVEEMPADEIKEMLTLLHEASKKELNMLDYLVEWARIKYASEVFSPEKIVFNPYVKKVFDLLNEAATNNEVILHNEVEEDLSVWADAKMLHSILQNLLSNAIKHSIPFDSITVSAKKEADKIIVHIEDTGVGMNTEILEKLFTPQMEALTSERQESKGAGIGLLLVKGFLEKNGGEIWVESVEGEGSSFYFTLPINNPLDNM